MLKIRLASLNSTCTNVGRCSRVKMVPARAAAQAVTSVSARVKWAIPTRMKKKLSEYVPSMPGSLSLISEPPMARTRKDEEVDRIG